MERGDEAATRTPEEIACFRANGELYAVDVMQIGEIVRDREVTPLPQAPHLVEGVVDLRGRVLPVIDLGRALGGAAVARGPESRIAVIEVGELALGMRVEAAVDVLPVEAASLEQAPALLREAGYGSVRSVLRRPGEGPVMLLCLEALLDRVRSEGPSA